MSIAAAGVLRRAALNAFRLNSFRAPVRTLSAGPKKPAAELTFKEAWLSDPATYPIVVIISSPYPASLLSTPRPKKHVPLPRPVRPGRRRVVGEHERGRAQRPKGPLRTRVLRERFPGPAARHLCTTQPRSSAASATAPSASSARRTCASPRRRGRRSLEIGRRERRPRMHPPV